MFFYKKTNKHLLTVAEKQRAMRVSQKSEVVDWKMCDVIMSNPFQVTWQFLNHCCYENMNTLCSYEVTVLCLLQHFSS